MNHTKIVLFGSFVCATVSACTCVANLGDPRSLGAIDTGGADAGGGRGGGGSGGGGSGGEGSVCAGAAITRTECASGPVLWAKRFGDVSSQEGKAVAPDGAGGVFIAGAFQGQLDLGGAPLVSQGGWDLFLARLDSEGCHVWSRGFGDAQDQYEYLGLTPAPDGGVVLFGAFRGKVDFGDGTPRIAAGIDGFIARYDASGANRWTRTLKASINGGVTHVAFDPHSSALLASGYFLDQIHDFSGQIVTSGGQADVFLAKLDADDGQAIWDKHFGAEGNDSMNWVTMTPEGNIVIGGATDGVMDLGAQVLTGTLQSDSWLSVHHPDGTAIFSTMWGGPCVQDLRRIVVDPISGDIIVLGVLVATDAHPKASIDFGGGPVSAANGSYLGRITADGVQVASRAIQGFQAPASLVLAPNGDLLVSGRLWNALDFGDAHFVSHGAAQDGFVARLGPTLEPIWGLQIGSSEYEDANGVAVDEASNAFALSFFWNELELDGCGPIASAGGSDVLLMKLRP